VKWGHGIQAETADAAAAAAAAADGLDAATESSSAALVDDVRGFPVYEGQPDPVRGSATWSDKWWMGCTSSTLEVGTQRAASGSHDVPGWMPWDLPCRTPPEIPQLWASCVQWAGLA